MDHLPLPGGRVLDTRRTRGNPTPEPIVRRIVHGHDLARSIEYLEPPATAADGTEEVDARVVLKINAATRLPNGPFSKLKLTMLGEAQENEWAYFVLSSRESRELFLQLLAEYADLADVPVDQLQWDHPKSWANFVDRIEGIELYGPDDRRDASLGNLTFDPTSVLDCLIWPSSTRTAARMRVAAIEALVEDAAQENPLLRVAAVDDRPDVTVVRVDADEALLSALLDCPEIERVRTPLDALITGDALADVQIPEDLPEPANTPIGIIDGIVNGSNPLTGPYVRSAQDFPKGHTFAHPDEHGTSVASIAIWGDLDALVTSRKLRTPYPIVSARVLDHQNQRYVVTGLAHVVIEEAVRFIVEQHSVKIVNVSIASRVPADHALRDELTATIDSLARELSVVIVVCAGNRLDPPKDGWLSGYPDYLGDDDARIASPGDAAIAVTVGSYAKRDIPGGLGAASKIAIAKKGEPSPFTRVGPTPGIGRTSSMKPEFVHHGGNWAWDHVSSIVNTAEPGLAAVVAIPPQLGRIVGSSTGTSLAAPAVAHELARIAERYPDADANLLRALLALSARTVTTAKGGVDLTYFDGYGEPDADRVLESNEHRVFLTFSGIARTNHVLFHRLPIPGAFAEGVRRRTLRVALAFDPPVRRGRREYIAGTMGVEIVRGISSDEVEEIYSRQPTRTETRSDPSLVRLGLPDGEHRPSMSPGPAFLRSNTLIRREFIDGPWDPDHEHYFLVVTHNQNAWTMAQRNRYSEQRYALAIEVADESETDLDLYAAIRARLRTRVRVR